MILPRGVPLTFFLILGGIFIPPARPQFIRNVKVVSGSRPVTGGILYQYTIVKNAKETVTKLVLGWAMNQGGPGLGQAPLGFVPDAELPATSCTAPPYWTCRSGRRKGGKAYWIEWAVPRSVTAARLPPGSETSTFAVIVPKKDLSYLVGVYSISLSGTNSDGILQAADSESAWLKGEPTFTDSDLEVASWKSFQSKNGWQVRLPQGWQPYTEQGDNPEEDDPVMIEGPSGCEDKKRRCAEIEIEAMPFQANNFSAVSPRQYLLGKTIVESDPKYLSVTESTIGGQPACEAVRLSQRYGNWWQLYPIHEVVVKHGGEILKITYSETSANTYEAALIQFPRQWKLHPVFEKILTTFSFAN